MWTPGTPRSIKLCWSDAAKSPVTSCRSDPGREADAAKHVLPLVRRSGAEDGNFLIAETPDGVEVDDADNAGQFVRRQALREMSRTLQPGFLRGERDERHRAFRRCFVCEDTGELDQHGDTAGVVIRSVVNRI